MDIDRRPLIAEPSLTVYVTTSYLYNYLQAEEVAWQLP
jgi:hypothetical protein